MGDHGDIKVFNPNKEISKEITLEILIRHRDSMKQARTGELSVAGIDKINDNDRRFNQVRALNLIISAQREMITISRPIIYFRSLQKWKKQFKKEIEQQQHPFKHHTNDYNTMRKWLDFLSSCKMAILEADKTKLVTDDFIKTISAKEGPKSELTNNFYEMLEDLESSYEQVYLLMLTNKIVSAGIEEDEELTYKEKEKEAIARVSEA
jgi:CTP-dependent riboflavin kinase